MLNSSLKTTYRLIAPTILLDRVTFVNRQNSLLHLYKYIRNIFEKFGTFGFLVDSVEEMAKIIETLKKEDLVFDFDTIQKKMNISSISEQLKEQLIKMNLL